MAGVGDCIYCGTALGPAENEYAEEKAKIPVPTAAKGPAPQPTSNRLFLILSPHPQELGPEAVRGLAGLLGWDLYTARLRLKNPAPGIIRAFDRPGEAQEFCRQLAGIGVDAYLMKEAGLLRLGEKSVALSAEISGDKISFQLENGNPQGLPFSELFLLVRGRARLEGELGSKLGKKQVPEIKPGQEKLFDRLVQRRHLRKTARLEIGALVRSPSTEVEVFDLYSRTDHRAIEVIESRFDFCSLFGADFQGRLVGIVRLIELLKSNNPELIVNENFNQVGYTYPEKQVDTKNLGPANTRPGGARQKLHDSRALFHQYSGIVYLHYLRKLHQGKGD